MSIQPPKLDSLAAEPLPVPEGTSETANIRKDVELGYDRTDLTNDIEAEDERSGKRRKGKEKEHGKGLTEGDNV